MKRTNTICVAALAAAMLAMPGAFAQEGIAQTAGEPARAQALASKFNIDQQRVLGMRRQMKMEWVEIVQALTVARAVTNNTEKVTMDEALNQVLSVRAMGQEWPDIAQQFGATLPPIQAIAINSQPRTATNGAGTAKAKASRLSSTTRQAVTSTPYVKPARLGTASPPSP